MCLILENTAKNFKSVDLLSYRRILTNHKPRVGHFAEFVTAGLKHRIDRGFFRILDGFFRRQKEVSDQNARASHAHHLQE